MKPLAAVLTLLALPLQAQELGGWDLLATARVTEAGSDEDWRAVKTFPPELVAAADGFEIDGYVVPTLPEPYLKTFLLVPDPAKCPYCGNSGYGPVLEVDMKRALPDLPEGTHVVLTGRLELNRDTDTFQMFRLVEAAAEGY